MDLKIHLDQIELRLRQVIETWIVPFNRSNFQERLARQMVQAIREKLIPTRDGRLLAPYLFTIQLNPTLITELKGSNVLDSFPEVLRQSAQDAGFALDHTPEIRLEPVETFSLDEIAVLAQDAGVQAGTTAVLQLNPSEPRTLGSAFLILTGEQIYPLRQAVTNLGRRSDNHVVIDDPRISRTHAQIRFNRGHYWIFDLNSTGGTSVNGLRIRQHTLKPGDVISLAGVTLIYGEEQPSDEGLTGSTRAIPTTPPPEELK